MELAGIYIERPFWIFALIPMALLLFYLFKNLRFKSSWQNVCDQHLLEHLIIKRVSSSLYLPLLGLSILWILGVIALMGPVWSKQKVRIYNDANSRVILLDLSASMNSRDVNPSRMERAKFKVLDMLKTIKTGQTALIVFAGDAFVVTPLTEDVNTIRLHVSSLFPDIMPTQGSRTDLALIKALQLLEQGGSVAANILLITDGIDDRSFAIAQQIRFLGHKLSVLAVGTADGAPVPLRAGGFLKDSSGAIVIPTVDHQQLLNLANQGGGQFSIMTANDADINKILLQAEGSMENAKQSDQYAEIKRNVGPWVVLMMLPIFVLGFRKGLLNVFILCLIVNYADVQAVEMEKLWKNNNQIAKDLYEKGEYKNSAELFQDPKWRGAAYYRQGKLEKALQEYEKLESATGYYNKGNVLAKLNRIEDAIAAYEKAISLENDHSDAKYNKNLLQEMLKQQQQQKEGSSGKQKQSDQKDKQDSNTKSTEEKSGESGQEQNEKQKQSQDQKDNNQVGKKDQQSDEIGKEERPAEDKTAGKDSEKKQEEKMQDIRDKLKTDTEKINSKPENEAEVAKMQKSDDMNEEGMEKRQSVEQWLRKVPDDPGGLLRRKFSREYQKNRQYEEQIKNW